MSLQTPTLAHGRCTQQKRKHPAKRRITRTQFEQLRAGSSITVIFDPDNPDNSAPNLAEMLSNALWSMAGFIVAVLAGIVFAREWRRRHRALGGAK